MRFLNRKRIADCFFVPLENLKAMNNKSRKLKSATVSLSPILFSTRFPLKLGYSDFELNVAVILN